MEMILIPAGVFTMGEAEDAHPIDLPAFSIAKYPVTAADYQAFVAASGHPAPKHWREGQYLPLMETYPVFNVSWYDALAYCRWLSAERGQTYCLPSEAEWEKAARGEDARTYPWGNTFAKEHCNTMEALRGGTTPVNQFPDGASPYGVMDLIGNVWEWCSTLFRAYPYRADDGREALDDDGWRVLRGGSWLDAEWGARATRRLSGQPDYGSHNTGFRVVGEV
jgi:formylglycine-generating enzyme required for sulfatase activity